MTKREVRELQGKLFTARSSAYTLPEICIGVKLSIAGAFDPMSDARLSEVNDFLRAVVDSWEYPSDEFDELVLAMCKITLRKIGEEMDYRKVHGGF